MAQRRPTDLFRERLSEVVGRSGLNPSAFARGAGVDRSTLAQLLDGRVDRLPRAETLVAVAAFARVSVDWLLGLSQSEQVGAEIIEAALQFQRPARGPVDDHFLEWMRDAVGARVKTVPVSLPTFLMSEAALRQEYGGALAGDIDGRIAVARSRLDFWRQPDTELECAFPLQQLEMLAEGAGLWRGMARSDRRAALLHLRDVYDQLYPGVRAYLFDQRLTTSAPFTVFGNRRAAIYIGERYLVFNAIGHIRLLSQRFDELIRAARVQPHALVEHVDGLVAAMGP